MKVTLVKRPSSEAVGPKVSMPFPLAGRRDPRTKRRYKRTSPKLITHTHTKNNNNNNSRRSTNSVRDCHDKDRKRRANSALRASAARRPLFLSRDQWPTSWRQPMKRPVCRQQFIGKWGSESLSSPMLECSSRKVGL